MRKKILLLVSVALIMTSCSNILEHQAGNSINKYYKALKDQDYEEAFKHLYLFDKDPSEGETSLSSNEAKAVFLNKIKNLENENYRVVDFKIKDIEYEDGHSFWHEIVITIEHNGSAFDYSENAFYHDGKLQISGEDPFIQFRDGKMDTSL
ncbi:hypothetical protein NCCP2222_24770 [Sporosarcina sp. NCCP-2222]|uniref:hypothetical protein n=1 Tax=Sporosarcina sp. NCCP-2222 TaxID=2935073 RepID=UPI00207EB4C8|nr:hypothetical protein [Sporosarcina sp. NCCP-2222]GKV56530.1 hypothetical protein NCCP2222_24770 [Sporosarcina sp. NCCP-2222]